MPLVEIEWTWEGLTPIIETLWKDLEAEEEYFEMKSTIGVWEPLSPYCNVREFGYTDSDWDWGTTEMNGTHYTFLHVYPEHFGFQNTEETVNMIMAHTKEFPGYRMMYCEENKHGLRFELYGGKYFNFHTANASA